MLGSEQGLSDGRSRGCPGTASRLTEAFAISADHRPARLQWAMNGTRLRNSGMALCTSPESFRESLSSPC